MKKKRTHISNLEEVLIILANNLDPKEYAKVTSLMALIWVGHTFNLSEDGFEFINLAVKVRKQNKKKSFKTTRQNNVIKLKPI
jgi:hypothetical protein